MSLKERLTLRHDERGFTLVELLVVIIILGILAAIVVFAVGGITDKGQVNACKADTASLTTAEESYFAQSKAIPPVYATEAQLVSGGFLHAQSSLHNITLGDPATSYTITNVDPCTDA